MGKRTTARALIERDGKILLIKQRGKWTLPGGGRKARESFAKAASRETREETGVTCEGKGVELGRVAFGKHKRVIYVSFAASSGRAVNLEPHKHSSVEWVIPAIAVNRLNRARHRPVWDLLKGRKADTLTPV